MKSKSLFVFLLILTIASIPATLKLVQQNQENRSKATQEVKVILVDNPYSTPQNQSFKGSVHSHSTISDGHISPKNALKFYKERGYDFVSLTDHVSSSNGDKIKTLQENNNTGIDILTLPGVERFTENTSSKPHFNILSGKVLTTELNYSIKSYSDFTDSHSDKIHVLNHPNDRSSFVSYLSDANLQKIQDFNAVEILNSSCSNTKNAENVWDRLLSMNKKIWGIAADDCHSYTGYCSLAFIRVFSPKLTREDIFNNIKKGNFYAEYVKNGGSDINLKISVQNNIITVNTDIGSTIKFISSGSKTEKEDNNAATLSYQLRGDEKYVRVNIIRPKSQAWSNPIFVNSTMVSVTPTPTTAIPTSSPNPDLKLSFKFSLSDMKLDTGCVSDFIKNKKLSLSVSENNQWISAPFEVVKGEKNNRGEQVFLVKDLNLNESLVGKINSNFYLKVKLPGYTSINLCTDQQSNHQNDSSHCNFNTNGQLMYFANYPLPAGDLTGENVGQGNGSVNGQDWAYIKARVNSNDSISCNKEGDLNLDGVVNGFDLAIMKNHLTESNE